jgi:hypothetical protein
VELTRESSRELYFGSRSLNAFLFAVVCGAASWASFRFLDDIARWLFGGLLGLHAAVGLLLITVRDDLRLDLVSRRYVRRNGFWLAARVMEGSVDEIDAVLLDREEHARSDSSRHDLVWVVRLPLPPQNIQVSVFASRGEADAYARAEALAKKLNIPLRDRTDQTERVIAPAHLDEPLVDRLARSTPGTVPAGGGPVGPPPAGSRIAYDPVPSRRRIVLPASGVGWLSAFFVLFGLPFIAFVVYHL